ncbi:MAG: dTDP-4-dehydrorhamnose reductase [Methylococcaceae bacterium]|nr:dTDP-4-dehydrorhamnose reductase [Methylococcaceae bacterium]
MKILLIGRLGQVAWELQRALMCLGEVIVVDRHSQPLALDLADNDSIVLTVAAIQPDLIINAAAYTAVDKAEQEVDMAMQVNGTAMAVLAEAANKCRATLVHYSTDYVFDGISSTPYIETQATAPQGIYGCSKLLGEQAIIDSGVEHLILRTAWVYGNRGQNFLLTMLRLMQTRESLGIVADQIGSPTWSRQIASATALMLAQCLNAKGVSLGESQGIYHLTCAGSTSWFGFAKAIYEEARQKKILPQEVLLNPITTADYPTPAKRPAYSVLSGSKLQAQFHLQLPHWELALSGCLAEYPLPA